jgi:hypothetical protein
MAVRSKCSTNKQLAQTRIAASLPRADCSAALLSLAGGQRLSFHHSHATNPSRHCCETLQTATADGGQTPSDMACRMRPNELVRAKLGLT